MSFSAVRRIAFSQFHPGIEKVYPVKFEDHFTGDDPARPVGAKHRTGVKDSKPLAEKTLENVLFHFGDTLKAARRRYRNFIKQGADQGTRPELQGGGLVRPACHARGVNIWKQKYSGIVQAMLERQVEGKARDERAGVPVETRLAFWDERKKNVKKETNEFWEAGIS